MEYWKMKLPHLVIDDVQGQDADGIDLLLVLAGAKPEIHQNEIDISTMK